MAAEKKANKVVLAYSGGLDTSVIIPWLIENYGCEVICFAADVGQAEELENLEARALQGGASKLIVGDLKEEFAKDYLFPMIHSGALYERKYFLGTSIARPVIAKHLVQVAEQEGADAIAHGCTGKGNDQVRFELAIMALNPTLKVIAPWREWEITSREDALAYLEAHGIPFPNNNPGLYSRDRNLWHISHEGGKLENLANAPDDSMFMLSSSPKAAPDEPETVEISFESGNPVEIDGIPYSPAQIVMKLNELGGKHGIGRVDMVENRLVGMKSRGVYETPGGTILYAAHQELESITLDRETMHMKDTISLQYAKLVYFGQWFTPLREAFDAFFDVTQKAVTGKITLQLYKGNVIVIKRCSPYSLYREEYATFGPSPVYDQSDAAGFIRLFGLSSKVQALIQMDDVKLPKVPIEQIVRD